MALFFLSGVPFAQATLDDAVMAHHRGVFLQAFPKFRVLAEEGNAQAQRWLGVMYDQGQGVPKDSNEAAKWYRKAADQFKNSVNAEEQSLLGVMYEYGQGVPKDSIEATKWYRKAADQFRALADKGDAQAQYRLGVIYQLGQGVSKDNTVAENWYGKAAEQFRVLAEKGDAQAQWRLGSMYRSGLGVPKDSAEAARWYRMGAEQGMTDAQYGLGLIYDDQSLIWRDDAEAMKWFRKAADQGDTHAMVSLGMIYYLSFDKNRKVKENPAECGNWLRKAAAFGNPYAQQWLGSIGGWIESGQKADEQGNSSLGKPKEIRLEKASGVYKLPVKINGVLTLKFILDTGASEVYIPSDVARTLLRTGTITQSDFLPGTYTELADGSVSKSARFTIRELEIGGIKIKQVPACIGPSNGSLLLGQSFLGRLASWSLDNKRHVLIVGDGNAKN